MKAKSPKSKSTVRERAIGLLARREHSRFELQTKLIQKGYELSDIEPLLDDLENRQWLSDQRFTECWLRYRSQSGHGINRIRAELKEKGVSLNLLNHALEEEPIDWVELAKQVWRKKYSQFPETREQKAKQFRFLQYRGFNYDEIDSALKQLKYDQGDPCRS